VDVFWNTVYVARPAPVTYFTLLVHFNYVLIAAEYLIWSAAYVCQKLSDLVKGIQKNVFEIQWNIGLQCVAQTIELLRCL